MYHRSSNIWKRSRQPTQKQQRQQHLAKICVHQHLAQLPCRAAAHRQVAYLALLQRLLLLVLLGCLHQQTQSPTTATVTVAAAELRSGSCSVTPAVPGAAQ
jgi:thiosulfate reductase cytochrome b subunit